MTVRKIMEFDNPCSCIYIKLNYFRPLNPDVFAHSEKLHKLNSCECRNNKLQEFRDVT